MNDRSGFIIRGKVFHSADNQAIPNLHIEAWDKDLIWNDLLGSAETDNNGLFEIQFNETYFKELFFDRYPDVFFKVYEGETLLLNTLSQVICNLKPGTQNVSIAIDYRTSERHPEESRELTGPLIDPETLFHFKRSLSKVIAEFGSKYPADALLALRVPFESVPNLLDLASGALTGDPTGMQLLREMLWSFGGKVVPSKVGIRVLKYHDDNKYIGPPKKDKRQIKLGEQKEFTQHTEFIKNYDNATQLVDLSRLEKVMAAAAYSARDVQELATLVGSVELALAGVDQLNTLYGLTLKNGDPIGIASAFDTAVRVSGFSSNPPFNGYTPGGDGVPFPGSGPGLGVPWYEWPLPAPGDPFPANPSVPVPEIPPFDSGLTEHFEECFIFSIIPELHRMGIGFRGLIYGVSNNYIIERVTPDHSCPETIITLDGVRFDGVVSVRYKDNRGRTISTTPRTATSTRITFILAENAITSTVWLYIPRTVRLCRTEHTVALPGVPGELIVGNPHIISFVNDSGSCIPFGDMVRLRWHVSPPGTEVSIIHNFSGGSSTLATGLNAVGTFNHSPTHRGTHTFVLEAINPFASASCSSASQTISLDVKDVPPPDFDIVGVEITQAIQFYNLADPSHPDNNSLELIASMDTVLRVYVRALSSTITRVTGAVELNGNTYAPMNAAPSGSTPIITASMSPARTNTNHSLNFLIPAADATGTGNIAQIRIISATNPCHNPIRYKEEVLDWIPYPAFPVTVRAIRNSDNSVVPDLAGFINRMFFRVPSPKTAIVPHPGFHQIREGTTEDNYCDDGGFYQLALSIAYEHNDNEGYSTPHSSSWIGIVTPTDCTPDGMMAWPSTSTCLSVQKFATAAHELMHTVGLGHTITGGGEGCWDGPALTGGADTQPVACHRLDRLTAGALIQVPFDISQNKAVSGASDLMSYRGGESRWLSPELWVEGRRMMTGRY